MSEIWRPVVGYEGLYEVSNKGRVRSLDRVVLNPKYKSKKMMCKGVILKAADYVGYKRVHLRKNGAGTTTKVHVMVANAFIPNPQNKPEVNHIDSNRSNNCVDNLEWCTRKENMQHAAKHGSLTMEPALKARRRRIMCIETGESFTSIQLASEGMNIPQPYISMVANGARPHAHGYTFRYL